MSDFCIYGVSSMDGMLVCRKPSGMVSKDVSRLIEKKLGKLKIGHVGTLDPLAEGVLPILFGRATKLQDYLLEHPKTYEFNISFGVSTDTCDSDGSVVATGPVDHVTSEALIGICKELEGSFSQVPPIYSAIKYKGKPLYEYARQGRESEVCLESFRKDVRIYELRFLGLDEGVGRFEMTCSKGTYVRSVAAKISELCHAYGMVSRLVRTKASGVTMLDAYELRAIEDAIDEIQAKLIPVSRISLMIPSWLAMDEHTVKRLKFGQRIVCDVSTFKNGFLGAEFDPSLIQGKEFVMVEEGLGSFGIGVAQECAGDQIAVVMKRGL